MNILLDYVDKLGKTFSVPILSRKYCALLMLSTMCRKCEFASLNIMNNSWEKRGQTFKYTCVGNV